MIKWYSKDINKNDVYLRNVSAEEGQTLGEKLSELSQENAFKSDLTTKLASLYKDIQHALLNEKGFIVINGLPSTQEDHCPSLIKKLLLEICKPLGTPLIQNKNNDIIFDVKSIDGMTLNTINSRGPYVKDSLPMHTDAGAILGMYCLNSSNTGGTTLLASSRAVHDEIEKIRPDLLEILYQPFYVDRRGNEPVYAKPYDVSPVFAMYDGELRCQYHQPFYLDAQTKFKDIPRLSDKQIEALTLFDKVALDDDLTFKITLPPGSIIFVNNEELLHGRTAFNGEDDDDKRHLLRIWLNNSAFKHTFPNFLGYV